MLKKIISIILVIGLMVPIGILTANATDNSGYSTEEILKYVLSSNKTFYGETKADDNFWGGADKCSITFTDFNVNTGTFNGKVEFVAFNVTDYVSGKIDGDKLVYKQTVRYQNGDKIPMDASITLKVEGSSKLSGKWVDNKTSRTGTCWFTFTLPEKQPSTPQPTPIVQTPQPTKQPANNDYYILKSIVSSKQKYNAEYYTTNNAQHDEITNDINYFTKNHPTLGISKIVISFTNFNEETSTFDGKIDWVGPEWAGQNLVDQISGKIIDDKLVFNVLGRYANGNKVDYVKGATVTMKIGTGNRLVGIWIYTSAGTATAAIWFGFTPPVKEAKDIDFTYDDKGFPTGEVKFEFGQGIKFDGEVKVVSDNFIAIGTIVYPDGTKIIGRFVNGMPDGLCSFIYPNDKAYLVDFVYGQPVEAYIANSIPKFQGDELEVYKANDVDVFQADKIDKFIADDLNAFIADGVKKFMADDIEKFVAEDVKWFVADDVEWFEADDIEKFVADSIKSFEADSVQPYKAEMIDLFKAEPMKEFKAESVKYRAPTPTDFSSIPIGGFTSPNYLNQAILDQQIFMHNLSLQILDGFDVRYR